MELFIILDNYDKKTVFLLKFFYKTTFRDFQVDKYVI